MEFSPEKPPFTAGSFKQTEILKPLTTTSMKDSKSSTKLGLFSATHSLVIAIKEYIGQWLEHLKRVRYLPFM